MTHKRTYIAAFLLFWMAGETVLAQENREITSQDTTIKTQALPNGWKSLETTNGSFNLVEEFPEYPGGEEARIQFLQENLKYPELAREIGLEGEVLISFIVEPDGRLTNFTIVRSVAPIFEDEALRVVKLMPNWKPGKLRGKAVRVQFQLPVTFSLN